MVVIFLVVGGLSVAGAVESPQNENTEELEID
jgi:hypothetical protein